MKINKILGEAIDIPVVPLGEHGEDPSARLETLRNRDLPDK